MYFNLLFGNRRCFLSRKKSCLWEKFACLWEKFFCLWEKFSYLWDRNHWISAQKEDRTREIWALSSSLYKYTTFSGEIQIPLTFRNTLSTVKMRRFAADGARRVLYFEERMDGSAVLAAIGMPEDWRPTDFGVDLELSSLKWVQLLTTLTWVVTISQQSAKWSLLRWILNCKLRWKEMYRTLLCKVWV